MSGTLMRCERLRRTERPSPGHLAGPVCAKMETIWLQRPSSDIPWGFRLQGGQDFDLPLSVHRVTPGSVASNGLSQGDIVLKIGNVNATGISHTQAQDVIKGASNILQLTIKKGSTVSAPVSPINSGYQNDQTNYLQYDDQDKYSTMPDYRVGSGYNGYNSNQGGYNNAPGNSPYDMRQLQQPPITGYSTLPVRGGNKQNNESFRPVQQQQQQQQNKYPYKSTSGITLQMTPQPLPDPPEDNFPLPTYSNPMSPVQYNNRSDSPYMRQTSNSSGRNEPVSYPQSYFKKPTPFSPSYSNGSDPMASQPRVQRQLSGQYNDNRYDAPVSQGYQSPMYSPPGDDAPPPPPPPVNYRQPEQYGRPSYDQDVPYNRQTSQNNYQSSPYSQQSGQYDQYQNRPNQGIYVDTSPQPPQYQRQGSRPYDQPPPEPYQRQQSLQRQPSYGSQQPAVPQYNSQYSQPQSYSRQQSREQPQSYSRQTSRDQPQSYSRQTSRDQVHQSPYSQQPVATSPPSGTGINSFDEILSPFEKFQNSNYCDKLFARSPDNRGDDSGVMSDMSYSTDTPRSNQSSNYSEYSPPMQAYPGGYDNRVGGGQNLLRPAPSHPQPAVTPPPPPPPPPPTDWVPPTRKLPPAQGPPDIGGQNEMPDKVLNTMLKHGGTQKPFAYVPTGTDLKEFKERARQRRQPRSVMPRGYTGPELDVNDGPAEPQQPQNSKTKPGGPNVPETGMYKHAQYNSPLRMYSDNNARDALNIQSGGNVDVHGVNNTPERSQSDIKDSEVYKMIKAADAQGKNDHVPQLEIEPEKSRDEEPAQSAVIGTRGHGLSFRVLQWMTDTADDDNNDEQTDESYKPKKPRNPLLRHNSEDDEMRFSGLHTKADIPSKAFQRLNKLAIHDADNTNDDGQRSNNQHNDDNDEPCRIGNYDEASIRYRGNYIPSPSFRLLQSLAKSEENKPGSPASRTDDEDDGLPDKLSEEDMIDKRYTGAHLPSKAFKALQKSIDTSPRPDAVGNADSDGSAKVKVMSRAPKTAPKPADRPITPVKAQIRQQQRVDSPSTDF